MNVARGSVLGLHASRPKFAPESGPLLSWEWALDLVASARNAWLATVKADGRPHVAPLWVVVVDGTIWFWSLRTTTKGRNLDHDGRVVLHVESGDAVAIVEGAVVNAAVPAEVLDAYAEKYESSDLDSSSFWAVEIESALAWQGHLGQVQRRATQFTASDE